jgi:hypothetical protein
MSSDICHSGFFLRPIQFPVAMLSYDFPLLRPERKMIGFESEEITLNKLRERLRGMTDDELIEFGKTVRKLCEGSVRTSNPFKFKSAFNI